MPISRGAWAAALCALALARPAAARSEETILVYERLSQTTALRPESQGGNAVTDTSRSEILIALGDHRLAVYDPTQVWMFDFASKRVQRVNTRDAVYSDWSLHAFVAFKEMELASRLAMRPRGPAGRPDTRPSVLELESLFSIPARSSKPGRRESLVDSSTTRRVQVWINGQVAVEAFPSDTAFAPGRARMFGRFLAFQTHLHPRARDAVVRTGRVPRQIVYRSRDENDETVVLLRLTRVASAPEGNDPTSSSHRIDVDDPEFRELNQRLAACRRCAAMGDWTQESRRFEVAAIDSGRFLEAALARAERVLGGCERDSAWANDLMARVRSDSAIAACRLGVTWRDSSGAVAALRRLDRVNGAGLQKGYVLDFLRGRARIAAGDPGLGAFLMMGGLGGNPCMAGAWLDLAHGYLRVYQPVLAWICLEAAEQAGGSGHCQARFDERATRERELETRYPDFFDTATR